MKISKKILASLVMATSMAVVSSSAFAAPKGEAEVKAAIENTISGIEAAQTAVKGGDLSSASQDILKAAQASKEFRFEPTERQRQRATDQLKAARRSIEKGDIAVGEASLESALKSFTEMKAKYDLTH